MYRRKVCVTCINEGMYDVLPLHLPAPRLSSENYLGTELFLVLFSIVCGFMQYFNIYQNAWWLPHSYPHYGLVSRCIREWTSNDSLDQKVAYGIFQNLHLIDWFVVQFILIMAVRPLLFTVARGYIMTIINRFENKRKLSPCIRLLLNLFLY